MKIFVVLFCCTLAYAKHSEHYNENTIVETPTGSFRGSILKSHLGKDIYSFRGIRYADAPTGKNRFKHAHLVKPHREIFNATKDGPSCPQPHNGDREISEDCLHLNVYTTELPRESKQPNRPVIVVFHAGGFVASSGSSNDLGPEFLLDHDVILVTFNYRLGALGFLSTGDKYAPGNAGLKDQVLALRWVKKNIKAFGGDPNRVTLAGHSAGSMSVTLHIVSSMSKGLFHRAFTMSGAATTQLPIPTADQRDLAKKQAELLGCSTKSHKKMFDCLYEKTPEEFAASYEELAKFSKYPFLVWTPVVEQEHFNNNDCNDDDNNDVDGPFLTGQPEDLIREGKANFVPFYTGANVDEFGFLVIPAEEQAQNGDNTLYDEWNNKWEELAPKHFGYEVGTRRSSQISKELKSFYLHDKPLKAGRYHGLAKLYADSLTFFQVHRFERLMATYSPHPVWYYQYHFKNCDTFKRWSDGKRFGIVHYDELILLFKIHGRPEICHRAETIVYDIWHFVVNFAETGDPTPESKADKNSFKWLPSTKDHPQYFEYKGKKQRMVSGVIHQKRMNKWDELFPLQSNEVKCK